MIRSIKVTNHNRESITFDLYHPETTGLNIMNIEGMGPPKATINSNEVATIDGGIFTSSRMTERNLVFTIGFLFDPLIEDARLRTYKYFPIKKPITIEFETDYRRASCTGYVESNTPNIFSKAEQTQISIICPDPYFYELSQEEVAFSGVHPMFEFPFEGERIDISTGLLRMEKVLFPSNPKEWIKANDKWIRKIEIDGLDPEKQYVNMDWIATDYDFYVAIEPLNIEIIPNGIQLAVGNLYKQDEYVHVPIFDYESTIEFGEIQEDNRAIINYKGDVDTGVLITCHVMGGTVENLTIWNVDTREHMRIDTTKITRLTGITFSQGDDIVINTKTGEKSIRLLHDGKYFNIISCIEKDANWFQLTTGFNTFTFVADHGENNMKMTFTYRNAYGGI